MLIDTGRKIKDNKIFNCYKDEFEEIKELFVALGLSEDFIHTVDAFTDEQGDECIDFYIEITIKRNKV